MKRLLPIILIIAMVVSLVSCSLEDVGGFMGFMSKNVYGIKANMQDVKDATKKIDDSVKEDESGKVYIDLEKAAEIIDKIGDISVSPQKKEEFQKELAQPVAEGEKGVKVQEALVDSIGDVIDVLGDITIEGDDPKAKDVVNMVGDILAKVQTSIPAEPTKADLATVAVINDMAILAQKIAKDPAIINDLEQSIEVVNKGLSALNTLKVVSEVAGVNLLEGIDVSAMFPEMDKSRDGDDEKLQKYFAMTAKNVAKLVRVITDKDTKEVDVNKYKRAMSQAHAVMASYEMLALPYIDFTDKTDVTKLDPIIFNNKIKKDLLPDDFILYFECLMMTASNDIEGWDAELAKFIKENYDALMDLGNKSKEIDFDKYTDLKDLAEKAMENVTNAAQSFNKLGTVAVLIEKANWGDLLFKAAGVSKFSELVNQMK